MVDLSTSSDQEQIDALKAWWKENGFSIIAGIVLGLGGIFGWQYWQAHQATQRAEASMAFANAQQDAAAAKTYIQANQGSIYATDLALAQAASLAEEGKYSEAATFLTGVIEKAPEKIQKLLARIYLAKVYVAAGEAQKALDTLAVESNYGQFSAQSEWARGDALAAIGKKDQAKQAYKKAQAGLQSEQAIVQLLNLKITNL